MCGCTGFKSGTINLIIIDHSRMIQAFRFIEISKYDDGGQLTTRGQLMQGSSTVVSAYVKFQDLRFSILVSQPQRDYRTAFSAWLSRSAVDRVSVPSRIAVDIYDGMQWRGTELACTCFLCKF